MHARPIANSNVAMLTKASLTVSSIPSSSDGGGTTKARHGWVEEVHDGMLYYRHVRSGHCQTHMPDAWKNEETASLSETTTGALRIPQSKHNVHHLAQGPLVTQHKPNASTPQNGIHNTNSSSNILSIPRTNNHSQNNHSKHSRDERGISNNSDPSKKIRNHALRQKSQAMNTDYLSDMDKYNLVRSYSLRPDTKSYDYMKCILCMRDECHMVFFPCQHKCVCNKCIANFQNASGYAIWWWQYDGFLIKDVFENATNVAWWSFVQ